MPGKHVQTPHWRTFPQMLFVFPPQSEVATGVKKTSPLPSPEVWSCICPLFPVGGRGGGDTSQSRRRTNFPVRGSPQHGSEKLLHACKAFMRPVGFFLTQRLENVLFGPHDCSHAPSDGYPVVASDGNVEASGMSWKLPCTLSARL